MNPIYDLPPWQFGGLTIVVFIAVALGGLLATRTWFRGRGLHALVDNGVIGWIFSAILVIYAIAIGLIAVQTWGNEERAAGEASDEASRIAALYRDLSGYPGPPAHGAARAARALHPVRHRGGMARAAAWRDPATRQRRARGL